MFNKTTAPVTEPEPVEVAPADLIPLSHLALDHPEPGGGWDAFLTVRNIPVLLDDLGRAAVSRDDAKRLFDERREVEARARELRERQEQQAVEADKQWRAQLSRGVSWLDMPPGVAPAAAMLAVDEDSRVSVREQLFQQELAHLSHPNAE